LRHIVPLLTAGPAAPHGALTSAVPASAQVRPAIPPEPDYQPFVPHPYSPEGDDTQGGTLKMVPHILGSLVTLLADGRVLIAGGSVASGRRPRQ
jgi:hypothetical protein